MDALETLRIVINRWKVVVPVLVLTLVIAVLVAMRIPDEYTVYGSMVVVDSPAETGARVSASLLAESLEDGDVRRRVRENTGAGNYSAEAITDDIIQISVLGANERTAVKTVSSVLDQIAPTLDGQYDERQVPPGERAAVTIINRPQRGQTAIEDGLYRIEGSAQIVYPASVFDAAVPLPASSAYNLLSEVLQSEPVIDRIRDAGHDASYEIATDDDTATLRITATGTDPDDVVDTVNAVFAAGEEELSRLNALVDDQSDGPPPLRVQPLVQPTEAVMQSTGILRSLVVIVFLGAALAISLAVLVERWSSVVAVLRGDVLQASGGVTAPTGQAPASREREGTVADSKVVEDRTVHDVVDVDRMHRRVSRVGRSAPKTRTGYGRLRSVADVTADDSVADSGG